MRFACCFVVWMFALTSSCYALDDVPPFSVPEGFTVQEVAGDELTHDAFCMTLDVRGRPVVSGPGYIRTLIDKDKNGLFESSVTWTHLPKQGAQGLWAEGNDLYWVGDGGLWLSTDRNSDLIADAAPKKILSLPTGGEHDAHAIRRGPDGYWYLIAGNMANGIAGLQNDSEAPVVRPRAGTLWRISPDFKKRAVWAHGMRNAYDFDFLPDGQIVTFDSDAERDVSLPWYRPTRIMVLAAGSDAGWVSNSWIDPDTRVTMPRVLAELGRGSPTGVAVYRHHAFPSKYWNAVFALDWTFGRILVIYPESISSNDPAKSSGLHRIGAETFMQPIGNAGFAPTDICMEPSGSFLVCVGGRGTRGGIYRIRYQGDSALQKDKPKLFADVESTKSNDPPVSDRIGTRNLSATQAKELAQTLLADSPWDSWSEEQWRPIADKLGAVVLATVATGGFTSESGALVNTDARRTAIQQLVHMEIPLSPVLIDGLLASSDPKILASAWWLIGRGKIASKPDDEKRWQQIAIKQIGLKEPVVTAHDWNSIIGAELPRSILECFGLQRWSTNSLPLPSFTDDQVQQTYRQATLWAISRSHDLKPDSNDLNTIAGSLLFGPSQDRINAIALDAIARRIAAKNLDVSRIALFETLTIIQASLGDSRHKMPQQQDPPNPNTLDSYSAFYGSQLNDSIRMGWAKWLLSTAQSAAEKKDGQLQAEALRTIAMIEPEIAAIDQFCLSLITDQSHPTGDIHALSVLARSKATHTPEMTTRIAQALFAIQLKVKRTGSNTDNHWQPRLLQLLDGLIKQDPKLENIIAQWPALGEADNLFFAEGLSKPQQQAVRSRVQKELQSLSIKQWTPLLMRFACDGSIPPGLVNALRDAAKEPALRSTAVELLAIEPQASDYSVFLEALASNDRTSWSSAWKGLSRLPASDPQAELASLSILLARMHSSAVDLPKPAIVARLRSAAWKLRLKGVPSNSEWTQWEPFFKANLEANHWNQIAVLQSPNSKWTSSVESSAKLSGDIDRGQIVFNQAKCAQCHSSQNALGPDLVGVTRRFSRDDLFLAIFEPSRDISDRYRAVQVTTADGRVLVGMRVYESIDGVTLQSADGKLIRVNQSDIEQKKTAAQSLMPTGLLNDMTPQQLADLYAYIRSL